MQKLLALLAATALVGAGCTSATQTSVETEAITQPAPAEDPQTGEVTTTIEVGTEGTSAVTDNGVTIEFETQTEAEVEAGDEGVPVTEIVLGSDVDLEVKAEVGNFSITPATITAKPGDRVKVTFDKVEGFHTFTIDAIGLNYSIAQGESVIFTAPTQPGQYPYYCDIGSHREFGMEGTLIVQ